MARVPLRRHRSGRLPLQSSGAVRSADGTHSAAQRCRRQRPRRFIRRQRRCSRPQCEGSSRRAMSPHRTSRSAWACTHTQPSPSTSSTGCLCSQSLYALSHPPSLPCPRFRFSHRPGSVARASDALPRSSICTPHCPSCCLAAHIRRLPRQPIPLRPQRRVRVLCSSALSGLSSVPVSTCGRSSGSPKKIRRLRPPAQRVP